MASKIWIAKYEEHQCDNLWFASHGIYFNVELMTVM